MQFKMIREAETIGKLGADAAFVKQVQQILGVDSIVSIAEAFNQEDFEITPQHYTQWLEVLISMANEGGINISKRAAFNDLAFDIVDNDSLVDAVFGGADSEKAKENIVNALWKAYQVSKAHDKVAKTVDGTIAQAREDEQLAAFIKSCEDEETSDFEQTFVAAKGIEDEERTARPSRTPYHLQAVAKKSANNPYPPNSLRAALWDDARARGASEDEEFRPEDEDQQSELEAPEASVEVAFDADALSADDLASHITGETGEDDQIEQRVDDLEARIAELEQDDQPSEEVSGDKPDPRALVVDKSFDEEERVKNIFHRAITSPKQHLSAALKDVEAEGSKAFAGLSLPSNPHPKKSQAYNAWAKGFKNSLKDALGLNEKPREVTSKQRKRK